MAIVYMATNRVNGKRYVGVTAKSLSRRRIGHLSSARNGSNLTFHRAIRKYSPEVFEWLVLRDFLFAEDALQSEVRYITSIRPAYNMTEGGDGTLGLKMSDAAKEKMRAKQTPERRAKASAVMAENWKRDPDMAKRAGLTRTGKPNLKARGKKRTAEAIEKIRAAGFENKRAWMKRRHLGPQASSKKVCCIEDGRIFDSASAAARHYSVARSALIELCLGRRCRKTVGGKCFKYVEAE